MRRLVFADLVFFCALVLVAPATGKATLSFQKIARTIHEEPVEIFIVRENGVAPAASWFSLPAGPYPHAGTPVPELAFRYGVKTAANANFYREDQPDRQEPIGLVIHEGKLFSLPNPYYPSAAFIQGRFVWDIVKASIRATIKAASRTTTEKICAFNRPAGRDCATLWLNNVPNSIAKIRAGKFLPLAPVEKNSGGVGIGTSIFLVDKKSNKLVLELPKRPELRLDRISTVTIEVLLTGQTYRDQWQAVREAVSGSHVLTSQRTFPTAKRAWTESKQPRTVIGADGDGRPFIAAFDGRRNVSRGASVAETWETLQKYLSASWILNLDGGGSTTLLFEGTLVNRPSDLYPRAVAVGWGAK